MGGGRPLASLVRYNPGSRVASWIHDGLSDHNIGTPGGLRLRNIVEKVMSIRQMRPSSSTRCSRDRRPAGTPGGFRSTGGGNVASSRLRMAREALASAIMGTAWAFFSWFFFYSD